MATKKATKKATPEKGLTELQQARVEAAEAKAEAITAKKMLAKATAPKGVGDVVQRKRDGAIKRPQEIMDENLQTAAVKPASQLTEGEKIAVEYNIRKYIKKGKAKTKDRPAVEPDFRKNLSDDEKARCCHLLKMVGRAKLDEDGEVITHDKDGKFLYNWDVSIQVPGMVT